MTKSKIKLFLYHNAQTHVHDEIKGYENTVPFSRQGISDHCTITQAPEHADYFYMGQYSRDRDKNFSVKNFPFFELYKNKHIIDLEGEGGLPIPESLFDCIVTVNGPLSEYKTKIYKLFTRPTFSTLFVDIAKNRYEDIPNVVNRNLGFKGFVNCQTRYDMFVTLFSAKNIKVLLEQNPSWSGPSKVGSSLQEDYINKLKQFSFALCPRGSGIDSVRLWEACYYKRIPILISDKDYLMVGEDLFDTSFIQKIILSGRNLIENLEQRLLTIINVPDEKIIELQNQAKSYFETIIRPYMLDPTKFMLRWLGHDI